VTLLDTNVLSALMCRDVDSAVVAWVDAQPPESIWTTSITVFEIRKGIEGVRPCDPGGAPPWRAGSPRSLTGLANQWLL